VNPFQEDRMPKKTAARKPSPKKTPPVSLKALKENKPRDEKLSIQNNPDSLPWIKNKVIAEKYVGKKKSG
jgi:hypothetical protein